MFCEKVHQNVGGGLLFVLAAVLREGLHRLVDRPYAVQSEEALHLAKSLPVAKDRLGDSRSVPARAHILRLTARILLASTRVVRKSEGHFTLGPGNRRPVSPRDKTLGELPDRRHPLLLSEQNPQQTHTLRLHQRPDFTDEMLLPILLLLLFIVPPGLPVGRDRLGELRVPVVNSLEHPAHRMHPLAHVAQHLAFLLPPLQAACPLPELRCGLRALPEIHEQPLQPLLALLEHHRGE
mmetsp:Transcript_2632/g.6182  ORF Transcript_2632/g.6182 Transcript_2632/m.6182 type:complete len:237 (-) Transcript_2632:1298-2008(-)